MQETSDDLQVEEPSQGVHRNWSDDDQQKLLSAIQKYGGDRAKIVKEFAGSRTSASVSM